MLSFKSLWMGSIFQKVKYEKFTQNPRVFSQFLLSFFIFDILAEGICHSNQKWRVKTSFTVAFDVK
jgi:hypothetical protein